MRGLAKKIFPMNFHHKPSPRPSPLKGRGRPPAPLAIAASKRHFLKGKSAVTHALLIGLCKGDKLPLPQVGGGVGKSNLRC